MTRGLPWQSGRFWAFVPAALLVSLVGTQLYLLHRAVSDPSFVVEDRYYAKAVSWDAKMSEERENARLGWSAQVDLAPATAGGADVAVTLRDPLGRPVAGAAIRIEAFAVARSARVLRVGPVEDAPGTYRAHLSADRPGVWDVAVEATRRGDRFTASVRRDLPVPRGR